MLLKFPEKDSMKNRKALDLHLRRMLQDAKCSSCLCFLHLQQYYGHIRVMYTVGYSLSLVALVLALCILIFFRYIFDGNKIKGPLKGIFQSTSQHCNVWL